MSKFDNQYYFVARLPNREDIPFLTADTNTEGRNYNFEKQAPHSPPFVFYNGSKEYNKKNRVKSVQIPPAILFNGANPVVSSPIRERLISLEIPDLFIHPTVYIHDDGKWYEDYWYMAFVETFDCWDRNNSNYKVDPLEMGGLKLYSVYEYRLDEQLMNKTPLEQRLLFEMGGTQDGFVVCHESILQKVFGQAGKNGAEYVRIDEY